MALILTIDNEESLPNGAPVTVRLSEGRGIDIGRSANVEWSLPDPTRFISGRHCEVRLRDGAYWLNDLSTNGTFLNDSPRRIQAPHRLRHGDRLAIGSYMIVVTLEETSAADALAPQAESFAQTPPSSSSGQAPLATSGAVAVDAQIAEAIAAETAQERPPAIQAVEAETAQDIPQEAFEEAIQEDFQQAPQEAPRAEVAPEPGVGAREPVAVAAKPFTMVRARGFFAPLDETPPPAAPDAESFDWEAPTPAGGRKDDGDAPTLDPREQEALAWSVGRSAREFAAGGEGPAAGQASAPRGAPDFADEAPAPQTAWPEPPRQQTAWPQTSRPTAEHSAEPAPAPASEVATAEDFLRCFAKGAGIPEHIFARRDALKVAEELGALMRIAVQDLTQLLNARFKAKRFARTSSQTMIQALDNNPLKFAPTTEDALKIMFGPRTSGYLDAKRAFEGAFADLKTHQITTFAAMQQAVRMLVEDLDPKAIEEAAGRDSGLAALLGGHKSRLWDLYYARWQAKSLRHEDGLVDAFMLYFAQCYDQAKDSN